MKIQLKRSNVLEGGNAKQPTAGQMEFGELAVNYNTNDPAIFLKDSDDNIVRIAGAGGDYNDLINKAGLQEVTDVGNNTTNSITLDTDKIVLNPDGSAKFSGNVTVGDAAPWTDTATKHATYLSRNGSIELYNPNKNGSTGLFTGYGNGDVVCKINTNGSAEFAGTGRFGTVDVGHTDLSKSSLSIYPDKTAAGDAPIFTCYDPSWASPTVQLKVDGSAEFDAVVKTSGYFSVDRDINPGTGALILAFTRGAQMFKVGTQGKVEIADQVVADKGYALAQLPQLP